jgi:hypothetical protein
LKSRRPCEPYAQEGDHVLARAADPADLAELRSALRYVPGAQRTALMTPGEPTVGYSPLAAGI